MIFPQSTDYALANTAKDAYIRRKDTWETLLKKSLVNFMINDILPLSLPHPQLHPADLSWKAISVAWINPPGVFPVTFFSFQTIYYC